MAPVQQVNNQKGQALLEMTAVAAVAGLLLFLLLKCFMHILSTVAMDALAEDFFFCELSRKKQCDQRLRDELAKINLQAITVKIERPSKHKTQVHITTDNVTLYGEKKQNVEIHREFDFAKFNQEF